jgi:colanic acid biosynthesis glycosyl transferase WcaI
VRRWPVLDDRSSGARKVLNLLWFCLRLTLSAPRLGRVDRVMAASTPPVAMARVASWVARAKGAEFVYHHQDIYPEVAVSGGQLAEGLRSRLLRSADARTDRRAARTVVLSEDMARLIVSRGVDPDRIAVINNFDPWRLPDGSADLSPSTRLRVVYAGNLGRFQNLEIVFSTLKALKDDDRLEFHFIGDGPLRPRLDEVVETEGLQRVHVHGYFDPERLAEFLQREADLGLVTLNAGVVQAAYPSKTMSYLRNGVPVVALVEGGTDLVRQLEAYGAGWSAAPERPGSLGAVLARLGADRASVSAARSRARRAISPWRPPG